MTVLASYIAHRTRERCGFGPCVQTPFYVHKVQRTFSDRGFPRVCLGNTKFLGWWGLPGRLGETQSNDLQSPFTTEHMASNWSASRATNSHVYRKLFGIPKSGQVETWPTWLMTMAWWYIVSFFSSISPLLLPLLPTPLQHSPICTLRPLNLITIFPAIFQEVNIHSLKDMCFIMYLVPVHEP